jgi:hypothetical protein
MLDVKKLITGFLILALSASASAWILSDITNSSSSVVSAVQGPVATQPLNNAFVNTTSSIPGDIADLLAGELPSSTESALSDPNNLTAAVGNSLLDGLISANPDGIQTDDNGNGQINQPDDQAILAELSDSQSMQNIKAPNWDIEAAQDQAKIKSSPTSSYQSMANYLNAFSDINNKYFVQSGLQQIADVASTANNSAVVADSSVITTANAAIPQALADAMRLTVPAPFITFQKSWIKLLVYEKNTAGLLNAIPTDPARTILALTLQQNNYAAATNEFEAALQKILQEEKFSTGSETKKNGVIVFMEKVFSIGIANAQPAVSVPVFDAAHLAATNAQTHMGWVQYLEKLALNVGLQILKNTLMAQLQSHVLKWIQGSGAPKFVQNWADDFANAAIMSATNAINSNFSCINTNTVFPRIQVILNAIYKPGNNVCAAQFASQLSSGGLKQFYNNFANGGFITFGQTLMPSNDFYGGLFFTAQVAGQSAQQGKSVLSVKTTAQQGFKGTETCADGSNPNGTHTACLDQNDVPYHTNSDGSCDSGYFPALESNGGKCANGSDPTTQSPGQMTGQMLDKSLGAAPQLIAGASTIDGLINAFTISLINSLASTLVTAASGAINGEINSLSAVSPAQLNTAASSTATSTLSMALSCNPANQTVDPGGDTTLFALGGPYDTSGNAPGYTWTSSDGQHGGGDAFDVIYNTPGPYTVTVSDNAGDASASCVITVNDLTSTTTTSTAP